jgi:hypothetical protein
VQNSTVVFQLNFSNKINFCASISRPNAKPQNVIHNTMKTLITIFAFFFASSLYGQKNIYLGNFKTTYFDNKIKVLKSKTDTAIINGKLDLNFYRKHFYTPYDYPNTLIDNRFKDTVIKTWADTTREKDFKTNWTFTLTYDSLSRVTQYDYSGCFICSQLPYYLTLFYDTNNRLIKIENNRNLHVEMKNDKIYKLSKPSKPEKEFYFKYDDNDNIIQVRQFSFGLLELQIDKM